jgi:hypothetical protein
MLLTSAKPSIDDVVWICGGLGARKGARIGRLESVPIGGEYHEKRWKNEYK